MKAEVRLEHELLAVETDHRVHAMLELGAPQVDAGRPRPPLNLALVIDRSGSMTGPKLDVAKRCAAFLARRLSSTDRLALVTYDDEVELARALLSPDAPALARAIAGINPGGSTNLSGGWLKGLEQVRRAPADEPRRVLLLTDGLANVGITHAPTLVGLAGEAAASGVTTTTIGFGEGFDEDLLTAMADSGRGNAHYAAGPDDPPAIFAREFEGLTRLVAQNVSVEIRASDDVDVVGILNDYPAVGVAGGIQIQLGDAYAAETRRVVFELHIPQLARLGPARVADVVVRYTSVGDEIAAHELTLPIVVNLVRADEAAGTAPDLDVAEEVVILKAARAEEEARRRADEGRFGAARDVLAESLDELEGFARRWGRSGPLHKAEQLAHTSGQLAAERWGPAQSKHAHYSAHGTRRGRGSHGVRRTPAGSAVEALLAASAADPARVPPDAAEGVLLGVATGNALGVGIEGWTRDSIRARVPAGVTEISPAERDAPWDDDVAQTVIVAEAVIAGGGGIDVDDVAARLVRWARDNGRGMGALTRAVIGLFERGASAEEAAYAAWDMSRRTAAGNGAVMRCAPIAVRWRDDPARLVQESVASALVTHYDARCRWSVVALNAAIALALRGASLDVAGLAAALDADGAPAEVGDSARAVVGGDLTALALDDPVAMGYTLKAMQVGLWCASRTASVEDALIEIVNAGGDTDTNGAVAGAVMGARCGAAAIPPRWLASIRGEDELRRLARALAGGEQDG